MQCDSGASAYEFFAGGGMARIGLAGRFNVVFANDIDKHKASAYRANHGWDEFKLADVGTLAAADLPGSADLAWASFPCQDLSLAGARGGLDARRSGAFWGFWRLMEALRAEHRAPRTIVLENVRGLLTSRGGRDFNRLVDVLVGAGYRVGAVELDAASFVPQSRARVFVVATMNVVPGYLVGAQPEEMVGRAHARLDPSALGSWVHWRLPAPPAPNAGLDQAIEASLPGSATIGALLFQAMSPRQRASVLERQARKEVSIGTAFRRVRVEQGCRIVRAEARFDGLAGCLRTAAGGSSRQFVLFAGDGALTARLMTPREAARLMGLPDSYLLPQGTTQALHLLGDGVCVPAVRWLSDHLLAPLAALRPPHCVAA